MFTFMLGAIGGALFSGSYVLLNTPRTGKENQRFVKEFYYTTKENVEDVSDKTANVQDALHNLNQEVNKLQLDFVPDIMHDVHNFQTEAEVYKRRINDGIQEINTEVDLLKNRIQAKTDLPEKMENNQ
jgi:gas vesicle protein